MEESPINKADILKTMILITKQNYSKISKEEIISFLTHRISAESNDELRNYQTQLILTILKTEQDNANKVNTLLFIEN
jgi:hypothetical protein